ncbi:hypothetical protein CY34DRAFT_392930 [Suillus luteus UH-Slu-Lm8-n1]|uniref:Uncharacterized protein n=1 Tax=Suillus luteus UH-Slu-Lm8-n1 TaxID=930992 RepID=A0A0D0AK25_9AGAM|nr:hypothetical protein CY34DRAFT_392930 [Suillus luteus UH-Slu-Lm8-n1]
MKKGRQFTGVECDTFLKNTPRCSTRWFTGSHYQARGFQNLKILVLVSEKWFCRLKSLPTPTNG